MSQNNSSSFLFRVTKPAMSFMTSFLRRCHYQTLGGDAASISQHGFPQHKHMHVQCSAGIVLPFLFWMCINTHILSCEVRENLRSVRLDRTHTRSPGFLTDQNSQRLTHTHFSFSHKRSLLFPAEPKSATCARGNHGDRYPRGRLTDRVIAC